MPARTRELLDSLRDSDPNDALRALVENALGPRTATERPDLVDAIVALRVEHPPNADGWSAQAEAGRAFDAFDRIGAIRAPTLIIQGTEDGVVDPRNSELLLDRIPGARRELLSGIGHLPYWEGAERFADLVTAFLTEDRDREHVGRPEDTR
jgi:pimeloyl-ACP methyl ester carboxylesterase